MADLEVTTPNLPRLIQALRDYPQIANRILRGTLRDILVMIAGRAASYPSPPPNSTYDRTGTLGRLWTSAQPNVRVSTSLLEGRVGNKTPYGPYVQSTDDQAWMHLGRWTTIEQYIEAAQAEANQMLDSAGEQVVKEVEAKAK